MNDRLMQSINDLADSLSSSVSAQDWQALASLDRDVATLMKQLKPAPDYLRPALTRLQRAHAEARTAAGHEAQRLDQKIRQLGENQDGWRAYQQMED